MPEFVDVATHFDNEPVVDAYTGQFLFNGQFNTFDESSPDGSVVKRRTMSVRPGTVMPPRKVITIMEGEVWIVGDGNSDSFFGERIRSAYWMKKATDAVAMKSPNQVLRNQPGTLAYIHKEYLKDTVNTNTNSEYDPQWDISMYPNEPIVRGSFILLPDTTLLRVRTTHADLNGLRVATCDEIETSSYVQVTLLEGRVYDSISDSYSGNVATYPGVLFDMYKLYSFKTNMDPRNHSGDMTLLINSDVDVKVGTHLTINGDTWSVMAKELEIDAWNLHVRRT